MNLDNISMYFKLNAPVVIYDLDFLLTHIEKLKKKFPIKLKCYIQLKLIRIIKY